MKQVGALGACVWLATVLCTVGLLHLSGGRIGPEDLPDYGLLFLGYAMVTSLVARRCIDASMVVVALWGGSVGVWCPRWLELCETVFARWHAVTPLPDLLLRDDIRTAVAIAAGGFLTASLLYIPTRSARTVLHTAAASLGVAVLLALPVAGTWTATVSAVFWHAAVCGAMCTWMVEASRRRAGGRCPRCGVEVAGLSSPVCPSCGAALASARPVAPLLAVSPQRRPI